LSESKPATYCVAPAVSGVVATQVVPLSSLPLGSGLRVDRDAAGGQRRDQTGGHGRNPRS
jgi:hypothetical protein